MATFIETPRFPDKVSEGSQGGPAWDTKLVVSTSGYTQSIIQWANAMHSYNAAFGVRDINDLESLKAFFLAMRGMAHQFRFKDWHDYNSSGVGMPVAFDDQVIGTGDGAKTAFQLVKNYTQGLSYSRPITKPVDGTVVVGINGVQQLSGWSVDTTTGIVTFTVPPADTLSVTAGYEFDVPARFNTNELPTTWEVFELGTAQVPIVEVRL